MQINVNVSFKVQTSSHFHKYIYISLFLFSSLYMSTNTNMRKKSYENTTVLNKTHNQKNLKEEIVHCEHGYNNKEHKKKRDREI